MLSVQVRRFCSLIIPRLVAENGWPLCARREMYTEALGKEAPRTGLWLKVGL